MTRPEANIEVKKIDTKALQAKFPGILLDWDKNGYRCFVREWSYVTGRGGVAELNEVFFSPLEEGVEVFSALRATF